MNYDKGSDNMIKVCFVSHDDICRGPMAEYIMKDKVKKICVEDQFIIVSKATTAENSGDDIYYGAKRMLEINGIYFEGHIVTKLEVDDYNKYDYFICMDDLSVNETLKIFDLSDSFKVFKILKDNDIKDPWYEGNFEEVYDEIDKGVNRILNMLKVDLKYER